MRSNVIWSFLSLVALATGGLITGCDSDATIAKSGEGESCEKSSDCGGGLKCLQGTCYESAPDPSDGGESSGTGGSVTGPPAPVLGSLGETCTKRADCEDGLACFNGRCSEDTTGEGGATANPVRLGQANETCVVSADCDAGLACRITVISPFVSVCTAAGGNVEPTGKVCGAECLEAADCCELPVQVHDSFALAPPYGTGVKSCTELASVLANVDCDAAIVTPANEARCFAMATYCDCAANTWSCTEAGTCVYEAACTVAAGGDVQGGCPSFTRSGRAIQTTCNDDVCQPPTAPTTGCTNDASCDGEFVADSVGTDTCVADECTCVEDVAACYRKCNGDLDCRAGRVCDMDISVCVPTDSCVSDASCIRRMGDVNAVCLNGACQPSCATDYDCNPGLTAAQFTRTCNADNVCELIGCEEHSECAPTINGVKLFCTAIPVVAPGANIESAITD